MSKRPQKNPSNPILLGAMAVGSAISLGAISKLCLSFLGNEDWFAQSIKQNLSRKMLNRRRISNMRLQKFQMMTMNEKEEEINQRFKKLMKKKEKNFEKFSRYITTKNMIYGFVFSGLGGVYIKQAVVQLKSQGSSPYFVCSSSIFSVVIYYVYSGLYDSKLSGEILYDLKKDALSLIGFRIGVLAASVYVTELGLVKAHQLAEQAAVIGAELKQNALQRAFFSKLPSQFIFMRGGLSMLWFFVLFGKYENLGVFFGKEEEDDLMV